MKCASCDTKACRDGVDCVGDAWESQELYRGGEDGALFAASATVEAEGYGRLNRIEELIRFCEAMSIHHIGMAFCVGLSEEARVLDEILSKHMEVTSVCCKVYGVSKEDLGLRKIRPERYEAACNPISQAKILAESGTELNVIVGLCMGHDILFSRHSQAPVTTLIVKDRVLGHNPAAALYVSYLRRRLAEPGR